MQWHRDLAEKLNNAMHGEAGLIIADYMKMSGKSKDALYRIAKQNGYVSKRQKRCDKGQLKSGLNEQQLVWVSALLQTTARKVKGVIMTVETALELAIDNGVIEQGQISVSRLQAILKERDMNKAALDAEDPSIEMKSLHPNHVHVFDASICIQYYLKRGKGLAIIDERDFNKKKPKNLHKIKQRLIRMVLVDHYSHALFVKYYVAHGENKTITYDFLCSAWRGLGLDKYPFRGVPFFLLMDAGSANIAKAILGLLEALEINIPKNMPHNPRRQGSAEVAQNIVERNFECRLHLEPAYTIEELNEWVQDWLVRYNAERVHSRHGMSRTGCWLQIRQEQLRELPSQEVMHELFCEPVFERTVDLQNSISLPTGKYRLKHIPGIRPKIKVQIRRRPYLLPQIAVIFNDEEYLVLPIKTDAGGFAEDAAVIGQEYKAQPETRIQKARKANENLAFGEERKKDDLPFGGTLQVHGHHADKVKAIPIPKLGRPMEIARESTPQKISMGVFLKQLVDRVGPIESDLNKALRAEFGTSIDVKRADQVIAAISSGSDWRNDVDSTHAEAL